jgi:tRNA-specific 2-thiouridylase
VEKGHRDGGQPFYFATGHYVRTTVIDGKTFLLRGKDPKKDQSYMLYRVKPEILSRMIFPLGELTKAETVQIATANRLPTSSVKESQDACFVDGDYAGFIQRDSRKPGLSTEGWIVGPEGQRLGRHRGFIHYTRGQRKGLGLGNGPWYVDRVEPETNTVYVCREDGLLVGELNVKSTNWFIDPPARRIEAEVSLRYQARSVECKIEPVDADSYHVQLKTPSPITPGQSAVFYDGDRVVGGGIIS